MTVFYDSARWGLIPEKSRALLYMDGRYAATPADARRFSAVRWITVLGGTAAARSAGAIDFEAGNEAFTGEQLREFVIERQAMNCRARVYCDRANLAAAYARVHDLPNVCYWISTLDGKKWTAAELAANLPAYGVKLAEPQLWAVQYEGGPTAAYDTSLLLGAW
jgi:hypothetical protein